MKILTLFFFTVNLIPLISFAVEGEALSKKYIINHSLKKTWAAAQIILGEYPLATNDFENGLIKTSKLKPNEFWQPPFENQIESNYYQYLEFRFLKINPVVTELEIVKRAVAKTDFLGSERSLDPNEWEQLRIVYKINREISVQDILKKY